MHDPSFADQGWLAGRCLRRAECHTDSGCDSAYTKKSPRNPEKKPGLSRLVRHHNSNQIESCRIMTHVCR